MFDLSTDCSRASKELRILLGLQTWDERICEGVERFARERGWQLDCRMRYGALSRSLNSWQGEGAIFDFSPQESARLARNLPRASSLPSVSLNGRNAHTFCPTVGYDEWEIGRLAGEYLLSKGYRSLALVSDRASSRKEDLFAGLSYAGIPSGCRVWQLTPEALPKLVVCAGEPIGVLASDDLEALAAIQGCRERGISVPAQVGIMGIGDRAAFCEFADVPVSSIDCGAEALGYRAAQRLEQVLNGCAEVPDTALSPLGVSERCSTRLVTEEYGNEARFSFRSVSSSNRAAC